MSISTSYYFDQAVRQMGDLQTSIAKTQTQISTGQQLTKPSDNPDKVNAIARLNSAIARQDGYASTLATVGDRLKAEETSIKSASDAMTRVKELAVQAANDTLGTTDRANIAAELDSIRASLYALAGTRDVALGQLRRERGWKRGEGSASLYLSLSFLRDGASEIQR